jgi:ferritin
MLISKELEQAINDQVGREFGASLQYFNTAAYFDADDLPELASFFYRQAEEEKEHALKLLRYVVDAGGEVRIPAVAGPRHDIASAEEAGQLALEWEVEVTNQINALMALAVSQNDYIAQDFLRWFVSEQLEEVSTMSTLLSVIRRAGDNILRVEEFLARQPLGEHDAGDGESE